MPMLFTIAAIALAILVVVGFAACLQDEKKAPAGHANPAAPQRRDASSDGQARAASLPRNDVPAGPESRRPVLRRSVGPRAESGIRASEIPSHTEGHRPILRAGTSPAAPNASSEILPFPTARARASGTGADLADLVVRLQEQVADLRAERQELREEIRDLQAALADVASSLRAAPQPRPRVAHLASVRVVDARPARMN